MLKFRVNYSLHQFFSNLFAGSQRFEVQLYNGVALALEDFADAVLHLCVVDAEEGDGGAQQYDVRYAGRADFFCHFGSKLAGSVLVNVSPIWFSCPPSAIHVWAGSL